MKNMVMVGVACLVAGCSTMTPEQRSADNLIKGLTMAPANLCYAILMGNNTPPEARKAAGMRNIDCNTPQMMELVMAKHQEALAAQAANREAYRNLQNIGTSILQQNQANRPRPLTNCMMVGNMMSCY